MNRTNGAQGRRHRVAIVVGGFGGLFAARALVVDALDRRTAVPATVRQQLERTAADRQLVVLAGSVAWDPR